GKISFHTKSPATGGYADSNMGGHICTELKQAGYDAVVINGCAEEPSYLVLDDDQVELRPAGDLWGKGCFEGESFLKDALGEDFQVALIGPAGENRVKFACIAHDFGRQAGRCGVGAVMGSKNLKAVAVRGTKSIPLAEPEKVLEYGKKMYDEVFRCPGFLEWTPQGTAGVTDWINEIGAFPTKNFWTGYFEDYKNINGKAILDRILVTHKGCFACPIPCGKYSRARVGDVDFNVEGPEYETVGMMGGNLMLDSVEKVAYANWVADDLGLDTISGGSVVAFAFECYEKGVLDEETVGRSLSWGDVDDTAYILDLIARREGIGDVLAEGVKTAAEHFGQGTEKYAIHTKGLEWSAYESRWAPSQMLAYATADVGAHHNRAWAITYDVAVGRDTIEGKAEKTVELQHLRPLFDALGICRFPWIEIDFDLKHYEKMFKLVTGMDYSWEELLGVSERIWNLNRMFNVKHLPNFGRPYDTVPERFFEEDVPTGPAKGHRLPREKFEELLSHYYDLRGWDDNGLPTVETLERLGLSFVVEELGLK
ncbi:MAG: aldehyde ferredoxin oxidoreductase family protein, partial [Bacillota bacterium]